MFRYHIVSSSLYLVQHTLVIENVGSNAGSSTQSNHNSDAANELSKEKKYDPTIDKRLPETVTLLTRPDGGKLYLVGTAHFSVESQNDVSKVIRFCTNLLLCFNSKR